MIRLASLPFEVQPYMIRKKDSKKAIQAPINQTQEKTLLMLKEAFNRIAVELKIKLSIKVHCTRDSIGKVEINTKSINKTQEFVKRLKEAIPDLEYKLVSDFQKSGLPDELLYKSTAGRGAKKEKHRKEFFKNLPENEYNPNALSDFDKVLRKALSKGGSLE